MQIELATSGPQANDQDMFDVHKSIAAIAYLIEKTDASMYPVLKMMYLADKMHLDRYGRFIAGDSYAAMKQGPVPSRTYNMIKHVRGERSPHEEDELAVSYFGYGADHKIWLLKTPKYDELSGSDVECLEEIVTVYKRIGPWAVRNLSHDEAWEAAWKSRFFKKSVPMRAEAIAAQLEDGELLINHMRNRYPGEASPRPSDNDTISTLRTGTHG